MKRRTVLKGALASAFVPLLSAPSIAQSAKTQTLKFIPQADLAVLDPIYTPSAAVSNHGYYVWDTLFSSGSDGKPKPQMAEGATVSDDGRTWQIKLRDGLKFHDGDPVLARDCAASLARWSKRDLFGLVLNSYVDSFGTADDRTIEIKLKKPFSLLLDAIGKPDANVAFMMPERFAQTDPTKAITEAIGSGPYRFIADEYRSGAMAVYEKFDGYVPRSEAPEWATGAKIAHFPRIEWHIISDGATASSALLNGEVDWWEQPLPDLLPMLAGDPSIVTQLVNQFGRIAQLTVQHSQPPFNNLRVRRALIYAINQSDFMQAAIGQDQSMWKACPSMFPCGMTYETLDDGTFMKSSIDAGKAELAASGYAGEKTVVMNPTDLVLMRPLGLVAADAMKRIGMNVDLQETDWGSIVQRRASQEPVEKGGWSAFPTQGSASNLGTPITSALVRGTGPSGWYGGWKNDESVQLTQKWIDATDIDSRRAAASALSKLAMSEVATIPLGQYFEKTAFRNTITGVLEGVSPYPWNVRPAS